VSLLDGFDVIVLDCDGVVFDTNAAKLEAFETVAAQHGVERAVVASMLQWQRKNFGSSRYALFQHLVRGEFGPTPTSLGVDELLAAYGEFAVQIYRNADATNGFVELLRVRAERPLFIVTGSDEAELRKALAARGLLSHFRGVYGSPQTKLDNLARVAELATKTGGKGVRTVMVGDAIADLVAAESAGVAFIGMTRYSLVGDELAQRARASGHPVVRDLADLCL